VLNQTIDIDPLIVVDDHSDDETQTCARDAGAEVITAPRHRNQARTLRICETVNRGLGQMPPDLDYVMIVGADNIIPPSWSEEMIVRMARNGVVIGSGRVRGSKMTRTPRGSRIVNYQWWIEEGDPPGLYREVYCWETYLVLLAWQKGYRTSVYEDLVSSPMRPVSSFTDWRDRGRGMRQCGANILQVYWRAVGIAATKDICGAAELLTSYLESDLESDDWLVSLQKKLIRNRLGARLRSIFR